MFPDKRIKKSEVEYKSTLSTAMGLLQQSSRCSNWGIALQKNIKQFIVELITILKHVCSDQ